jgi:hypothetical protein
MTDETKPNPAMKSKEEILTEVMSTSRQFRTPSKDIYKAMEIYATQQTAELQQEVERLKGERDGERLQVERLMIENGVMFKALQKIESLYWEYIVATQTLTKIQQDENGR